VPQATKGGPPGNCLIQMALGVCPHLGSGVTESLPLIRRRGAGFKHSEFTLVSSIPLSMNHVVSPSLSH